MGIMFMHKNSAIASVQCHMKDLAFQQIAMNVGVRMASYCNPGSNHFNQKYITLNITLAIRTARIAIYAAEHNKWPSTA